MRKILIILAILLISPAVSSENGGDEGCSPRVSVNQRETENAFMGKSGAVKDAVIFSFHVQYSSCDYSNFMKEEIRIKELVIPLWGNLDKGDFANVRIKDEDTGAIYPVKIEDLDKKYFGPNKFKLVINMSPVKLRDLMHRNFSIISDFPNLKPRSYFYVKFDSLLYSIAEQVDGKILQTIDVSTGRIASHYNGKRPSRLLWVNQREKRTVFPDKGGLSGDTFEFRVKYRDDDDLPPKKAQVWIDVSGDGKFQENEKFDMRLDEEIKERTLPYYSGVDYYAAVKIFVKKPLVAKFRFYFTNGDSEAENGVPFADSIPTREMEVFIGTPVVIKEPRFSSLPFVSGETIRVTLPVFHLYRDVEINWKDIEKADLRPFKLLYWRLGRHGITSPEYELPDPNFDFQEITLFLSTEGIKAREVKFPEIKISYKFFGDEKIYRAIGGAAKISRANYRVERSISRQLIRIGDPFDYRLKITRSPEVKIVDFKAGEISFWPLADLKRLEKHVNRNGYAEDEYVFTLTGYFMITKPIMLPEIKLKIGEGKKSQEVTAEPIAIGIVPQLGQSDVIMAVWDGGVIAWPQAKTYLMILLPLLSGGLAIAVVILYFLARRILDWLKVIKANPKWLFNKVRRQACRLCRKLLQGRDKNENSLIELLNKTKVLIGLNWGIGVENAKALSAREAEVGLAYGCQLQLITDLLLEGNEMALSNLELMIFNSDFSDAEKLILILRKIKLFLSHVKYLPR